MAEKTKGTAGLLALLPVTSHVAAHRLYVRRPRSAAWYLTATFVFTLILVLGLTSALVELETDENQDGFVDEGTFAKFDGDEYDFFREAFLPEPNFHGILIDVAVYGYVLTYLVAIVEGFRFLAMDPVRFRTRYVFPLLEPDVDQPPLERERLEEEKRKDTAGILGILLGWLGVHRFYLGSGGIGFLFLLFGLIGLGALITGLVLEPDVLGDGLPENLLLYAGIGILALVLVFAVIDGIKFLLMDRRTFKFRFGREARLRDEAEDQD